nr:hypothetical protein [Actinomycetota bacterium]
MSDRTSESVALDPAPASTATAVSAEPPTSAGERPAATLPLPNALAYAIAAVAVIAALILPFAVVASGESLTHALANYHLNNMAHVAVLGALILWRRPGHAIGWLLIAVGGIDALATLAREYRLFGPAESSGLPSGVVVEGLLNWLWVPTQAGLVIALPQLFPDGRLLSRRWRPLAWFGAVAVAPLAILFILSPDALEPEWGFSLAFPLFGLAALASLVPLVVRYRRSAGVERQQFKWVLYGLALSVTMSVLTIVPGVITNQATAAALTLAPLVIIPAAITVAVLRYRLYDIDLVINKTVVFVVLGAFITGVYAVIVVGVGRLLPIGAGNLGLAIAATAVVAVAFEPVRVRVQHWANRLVYGQRATPYEALAAMTAKLSESAEPSAALGEAAQLLADGTGAAQTVIWV